MKRIRSNYLFAIKHFYIAPYSTALNELVTFASVVEAAETNEAVLRRSGRD